MSEMKLTLHGLKDWTQAPESHPGSNSEKISLRRLKNLRGPKKLSYSAINDGNELPICVFNLFISKN